MEMTSSCRRRWHLTQRKEGRDHRVGTQERGSEGREDLRSPNSTLLPRARLGGPLEEQKKENAPFSVPSRTSIDLTLTQRPATSDLSDPSPEFGRVHARFELLETGELGEG